MKIIACSDLHCGTTANYAKFHDLLRIVEKEKPHQFIMVGDSLELIWHTWDEIVDWSPSREAIDRLKFIAQHICPVKMIPGNHDLDVLTYWPALFPIRVAKPVEVIDDVVYTHGNQFDPSCKYWWEPLERVFKKYVPWIGLRLFGTPFELKKAGKDISYSRLCALVEANYILWLNGRTGVFGHTHSEFEKRRKNQTIANCGDFFDSCSFLRINDGKISLDWV